LNRIKKFIYLISPQHICKNNFYRDLNQVFKTGKIAFFQLRLKKVSEKKIISIGKKVNKVCKKYGVKFIINDKPALVKKIGADGCHLGQNDMNFSKARKIIKANILGVTCHNSMRLVKQALVQKVDYIAIGSFFNSNTKRTKFRTSLRFLGLVKKMSSIPVVVIGGINEKNYKKLLLHKADFLAMSGYIWDNKKLNPVKAVKNMKI